MRPCFPLPCVSLPYLHLRDVHPVLVREAAHGRRGEQLFVDVDAHLDPRAVRLGSLLARPEGVHVLPRHAALGAGPADEADVQALLLRVVAHRRGGEHFAGETVARRGLGVWSERTVACSGGLCVEGVGRSVGGLVFDFEFEQDIAHLAGGSFLDEEFVDLAFFGGGDLGEELVGGDVCEVLELFDLLAFADQPLLHDGFFDFWVSRGYSLPGPGA